MGNIDYVPSWIDDCYTLLAKINKCIEKTEEVLSTLDGKQDKLSTTQLSAVNSGITQEKVEHYDTIPVVVGNPTGSGATNLTKLKIGNTIYLVPEGTEVEANPTGSGSVNLTKIKIGDTVYLVPEGTIVEGNPTGSGSVNLTKIKIGDTVYLVPEGTIVEGNPTGSGSVNLTKIKIGDTVYNIPSGGSSGNLYFHSIYFTDNTYSATISGFIISTESNPYTKQTLPDNILIIKNNVYDENMNLGININISYSKISDTLFGDYFKVLTSTIGTMNIVNPIMSDNVIQL